MKRRNFLASAIAGLAIPRLSIGLDRAARDEMILPGALRAGDLVGLITPATYVTDPDRLAMADRTLKYFGLRTKLGKHVGKRSGYFGSPSEARLEDLHEMFSDPEVRGVFAIRGGYGSSHLLDRVDYDLIRRRPKVFIGYSDITALHLAINKYAKLVTFHGPLLISPFTEYTRKWFRSALFDTRPLGTLSNPPETNELRPAHTFRTIRPGSASGRLIGGNLTLISTTMGTPYEIDTRGRILFLEDVDEETFRIDRMLTQLRLAKKFDDAVGVIVGECQNCGARDYQPTPESNYSIGEVLDNILAGLKIPVLHGLTLGHTADQLTLPLGVMATLNADKGTLEINESAVTAS